MTESPERSESPAPADAGILRVLLVEDSVPLAERISALIRTMPGVELVTAVASERAAVEAVANQRVDAVVLDLNLQQGNGFGVLRSLRTRALAVSVIVFTSYDIPAYRRAASALGATEFLHKARDYDKLPAVLGRLAASQASDYRASA